MDIKDFLLARIAEDEEEAARMGCTEYYDGGWSNGHEIHVRRECAAKRAIVGLHDYEWMGPDDAAGKGCEHDYEEWPCPTIRHLAAVYSDHPDYRQEWAA